VVKTEKKNRKSLEFLERPRHNGRTDAIHCDDSQILSVSGISSYIDVLYCASNYITLYVFSPLRRLPRLRSNATRANNPLSALLLAGCSSSSPFIPGIFLISLYYQSYTPVPSTAQADFNVHTAIANIVGKAHLEARVGFFGICINVDGGSWLCSNNATALANQVTVDQDPLNLIWLASQFKDMIVFPYLM
jgi:hypothetical protein